MTSGNATGDRNQSGSQAAQSGSKAAYIWPGVVVALLGGHVVVCLVAVALATGDPSAAVEPDYYQRAVNWDSIQRAKRESAALGWTTTVEVSDTRDPLGKRMVTLKIVDREGQPVAGFNCELMLYHRARANNRETLMLTENEPGCYSSSATIRREGFWEYRLAATSGMQNYLWEDVQFVRVAR
ncbi:MAG: FixH family protein [Planctomycetota bacterium]